MKNSIFVLTLLVSGIAVYSGCTKISPNLGKLSSNSYSARHQARVKEAKKLFEQNIAPNSVQKFKKTPVWEFATTVTTKSGYRVIVPLEYDRNYAFKASISKEHKLLLKDQSHLLIYTDAEGSFHAEIITRYPDENYLTGKTQAFSGYICVSSWDDNIISKDLYFDGKLKPENIKKIARQKTQMYKTNEAIDNESVCSLWADFYYCPQGWNTYGDCDYMFSVCMDNIGGGNNNGNGDDESDYHTTKSLKPIYDVVPGNDTLYIAASANLDGSYGIFVSAKTDSKAIGINYNYYSYAQTGMLESLVNNASPTYALVGFTGKVVSTSSQEFPCSRYQKFIYTDVFPH